jgi:hypothetical protein
MRATAVPGSEPQGGQFVHGVRKSERVARSQAGLGKVVDSLEHVEWWHPPCVQVVGQQTLGAVEFVADGNHCNVVADHGVQVSQGIGKLPLL